VGAGLYTAHTTFATYNRLLDLARMIMNAGYTVIVDATFLKRWQRDLFRREARARRLPFAVIDTAAPENILRERIAARLTGAQDASEADQRVLTHQLGEHEPLAADEMPDVLHIDTARGGMADIACAAWRAWLSERQATAPRDARATCASSISQP
jgi:uncharacterized protein